MVVLSALRRLTLLLLAGCQGAAGPDAVVAQARSLAAVAPEVHARLAAAQPLQGLEGHGAAVLKSAPQRVLVARLPSHAAAPLFASDSGAARRALKLTLLGAAKVEAQPSGAWLVYGGALADTDLAMFAGDTLVEALFVLRSQASPRQLDYRLELAEGLTARTTALGIELCDASGDVALRIPPSRAFDAHGAELPVRQWLEGDVLHFALQGAPEAWPVLLDPVVEVAVWQQRSPGNPMPLGAAAVAYDSARDRVVLFGGRPLSGFARGETWEWDGAAWQLRSSSGAPGAYAAAAAYDPTRGVTVIYGGETFSGSMKEPWEWDGTTWTQKPSPPPPGGADYYTAMTWDGASQRLVMVGGRSSVTGLQTSTTVTWDGASWSAIPDAGLPTRMQTALAYDPARGVVVLFGGYDNTTHTYLADTWELSGSVWTRKVPPPPLPPPRIFHALAYSAARGTVVLSGGDAMDGGVLDDLWEWNGTAWSQLPNAPFGRRASHSFVYDSLRRRDLVMMGFEPKLTGGLTFADVWAWDGGTWLDVTPRDNPPVRRAAAMAYDATRGVTTLFGGNDDTPLGPLHDTWEWDGARWSLRAGPTPPATDSPAMAFDVNRRVQVLSTAAGETWEWDGGSWQHRATSLPGTAAALAYDALRGVTVAVVDGGVFEYGGSAWSPRFFSGPAPAATTQLGLAADGHGRTWLFGGAIDGGASWSSELWAWDGGAWTQLNGPLSLQRGRASWLWDTPRDLGVLFGGATADLTAPFEDTQLFTTADGGSWKALSGTHPAGRLSAAFAYDSRRGRAVLFGGADNAYYQVYFGDTWELGWLRANGSDCADAGQCASGFCTDGVCCTTGPCAGRCAACNSNGLGTCAAADAGAPGAPVCAPYVCDGASMSCPMSCSTDAGCASGASCMNGTCSASLPKGADCINDAQCLSGHCVGNLCCLTACGGGCQTCRESEGASEDGVCGARASSHTCRAAADVCDLAETCDGVSPDCPEDRLAGTGVMCRAALDTCDLAELCTGASAQCPGDTLQPHGTTCVSSLQTCAAASQCDGVTPLCPASAPALASTPCRPLAGPCDRAELCDGVHLDCPADELLPAGTSCSEEQECAAECTGSSVECSACAPVSRFAFGCAAAPGSALALALLALWRRRRTR